MKNTLFVFGLVFFAGQLCHMGVPWWGVAPIGALAGWLFPQNAGRGFIAAFLGGFLLWLSAAYLQDVPNEGILSARIGNLFMGLSGGHILLLTGILGGLPAGFGYLTGHAARSAFEKK